MAESEKMPSGALMKDLEKELNVYVPYFFRNNLEEIRDEYEEHIQDTYGVYMFPNQILQSSGRIA